MKKWSLIILSAVLVLSMSACGKKEDDKKKSNTELDTTKSNIAEEEYVNCFDVQSAAASIVVNDQQMTFPIDITKLKSTISFGSLQETTPPHYFRGTLLDENVDLCPVEVYSESGDAQTDGQIFFLEVTDGSPWYLSICGVTFGASIDEVKAAVGTPVFENGNKNGTYRVYYQNCSYEYISFLFNDGKLKTISFEYLPEELRNK